MGKLFKVEKVSTSEIQIEPIKQGVQNSNRTKLFSGEQTRAIIDMFLPILRVFLSRILAIVAKF